MTTTNFEIEPETAQDALDTSVNFIETHRNLMYEEKALKPKKLV